MCKLQFLLFVLTIDSFITGDPQLKQCTQQLERTCLPDSLPIIRTTSTKSSGGCCQACLSNLACVSWTFRSSTNDCYQRATYTGNTKAGVDCTSGQARQPPPSPPPPPFPPKGAPNVLLMLVDDLRPMLPFYGADRMMAPNLAKFAASGLQFNNSYVQQAICSPTRNSFMTGQQCPLGSIASYLMHADVRFHIPMTHRIPLGTPDHTRLWNFKGSFRSNGVDSSGKLGADWQTLPQAFKEAGWITAGCGKTFHPGSPPNWDGTNSWSPKPGGSNGELLYPYVDPDEQIGAQGTILTPAAAAGNLDNVTGQCCSIPGTGPFPPTNFSGCLNANPGMAVKATTVCNEEPLETTDYKTASIAIANLRNLSANSRKVAGGSKRPWFLAVGLHKPHPYWPLPLSARQQYMDLPLPKHRYAPIGMPPVAFVSCDYLQDAADVKAEVDAGGGILPNTTLSDTLSRKIRSGYAAGVTWMDRQAGRVLDELDALGHREDTVVLFTADHGWGLGEHGMWCKYTIFENQARVPLLVRVPWLTAGHGKTTSALVELVDIFPTLADLAGILSRVEQTEALDGKSFKAVLSDPLAPHKPAAFSQYPRCMNSSVVHEPPYTANRDVCAGHPASEFTHMGLSIRTDEYRYSEWLQWDGKTCSPGWAEPNAGVELYSHIGDNVPGCFDCFENVNLVGTAAGKAKFATLVGGLHAQLVAHYKQDQVTSCPNPVSDAELAGIDMTLERFTVMNSPLSGRVHGTTAGIEAAPKPRLVSWYGAYNASEVPATHSPDDLGRLGFTHIVASAGTGLVTNRTSGAVTCDRDSAEYVAAAALRAAATQYGLKVMAGLSLNGTDLVKGNGINGTWFRTYLSTIGPASVACGVEGGEWDYEPTFELSDVHRKRLTSVLGAINKATSVTFDVALDLLVWGLELPNRGSTAPLDWRPYVDVEMTNAGLGPSFINTESYHWPARSTIVDYRFDAEWLVSYGLDKARVNIGPPMYSYNNGKYDPKKHHGEPTWRSMAEPFCPNITFDGVDCDGVRFNSRQMMFELGTFIADGGWGGAFPWAADYDAVGNLSLIRPLAEGMGVLLL